MMLCVLPSIEDALCSIRTPQAEGRGRSHSAEGCTVHPFDFCHWAGRPSNQTPAVPGKRHETQTEGSKAKGCPRGQSQK